MPILLYPIQCYGDHRGQEGSSTTNVDHGWTLVRVSTVCKTHIASFTYATHAKLLGVLNMLI